MPALLLPPGVTIFSLGKVGTPADQAVLDPGSIAGGLSVRAQWATTQPTQPSGGPTSNPSDPSYDWSFLDSEISRAAAANKPVFLRVLVQGNNAPGWIYNTSAQTYVNQDGTQTWIWYDSTALSYHIASLQAMATRYGSNSAVRIVAAEIANSTSGDWSIPHQNSNWTLLNPQSPIHCPPYSGTVTVIPNPNQTVYVGWVVYINTFGWFQVQAITGPNTNPTSVTLLNLGIAGNASSGTIGLDKLMQVSDINNLIGPVYNYTTQKLINAVESAVTTLANGFPNSSVYLACGRSGNLDPTSGGVPPVSPDQDYACAQITSDMHAAYQNFMYGKNQFNADTSSYPPPSGTNFSVFTRAPSACKRGGQATWFTFTDQTYRNNGGVPDAPIDVLQRMMDIAGTYGLSEFEMYQVDVENVFSITPPTNLSLKSFNGENLLSWDGVPGAQSYNVYWTNRPDVSTLDTKLVAPVNGICHKNLTNNIAYHYVVTTIIDGSESSPSQPIGVSYYNGLTVVFTPESWETEILEI